MQTGVGGVERVMRLDHERSRLRFALIRQHPVAMAALGSLVWAIVVLAPVVFTNRGFSGDWWLHLWMIHEQQRAIEHGGLPGVTMSFDPVGALAPIPMIYGGTLYALGGVLGALGLDAINAYVVLSIAVAWAATFGTWWATYQLTARPWVSWLPAFTLTSAAYFLGDPLGRGGFSNHAATMVLPLAFAGALHMWRRDGRSVGGLLALIGSVVIATGSHSVALLWTVVVVAVSLGTLWLVRPEWRSIPRIGHRAGVVALAIAGGTMVNGWFLLGMLAVHDRVFIGGTTAAFQFHYDWSSWFGAPSVWFSPLRTIPSEHIEFWRNLVERRGSEFAGSTSFYVQLPVLAVAWVVVMALVLRRSGFLRAQAPLLVPFVAMSVLILVPRTWAHLPDIFRSTQFSMRLNNYIILLVAAMVSVTLVVITTASPRVHRTSLAALTVITAFSVGQVLWQGWTTTSVGVWVPPTRSSPYDLPRTLALASETSAPYWYDVLGPRATDGREVRPPPPDSITFPLADARDGEARVRVGGTSRERLLLTNVVAPLDLVRFEGVSAAGRTPGGRIVVRQEPRSSPADVRVALRWPWYRSAGLVVSLVGITIVLLMLIDTFRSIRRPARRA
jgi:hypothetical protein